MWGDVGKRHSHVPVVHCKALYERTAVFSLLPLIALHNRGFPVIAGAGLPGGHNRALLHRRPFGSPSGVSNVIRREGRGRGCSGACLFPGGGDHSLPLGGCGRGGQAADATPDQLSAGEKRF
jgi:hypothetical protein